MKDKRGISGIVEAVILIGLVMAAAVAVWVVVNNVVKGNMDKISACSFENLEKVKINPLYTCYEVDGSNTNLAVSVSAADITLEKLLISASSGGSTKIWSIDGKTLLPTVYMYGNGYNSDVKKLVNNAPANEKLLVANSGETYVIIDGSFNKIPDVIKIYPIISGKQCDASDSISDIPECKDILGQSI